MSSGTPGSSIVPNLIPFLGSWADSIVKYTPSDAGESFVTSARVADALTPTAAILVLALWAAAALVAASLLVRRRDA